MSAVDLSPDCISKKIETDTPEWGRLETYFEEFIAPLYGDQRGSLEKIKSGSDRAAYFIQKEAKDIGILIHKSALVEEHASLGLEKAFEIKTLMTMGSPEFSKGVGRKLLSIVAKKAASLGADGLVVTASSARPEVLAFFLNYGFVVRGVKKDGYRTGLDEYVFVHYDPKALLEIASPSKKQKKIDVDLTQLNHKLSELRFMEAENPLEHSGKCASLCAFKAPKQVEDVFLIFEEPLFIYENEKKVRIGSVLDGWSKEGERVLMGFCPKNLLNEPAFWHEVFSHFKEDENLTDNLVASFQSQPAKSAFRLAFSNKGRMHPSKGIKQRFVNSFYHTNDFQNFLAAVMDVLEDGKAQKV